MIWENKYWKLWHLSNYSGLSLFGLRIQNLFRYWLKLILKFEVSLLIKTAFSENEKRKN